MNNKNTFLDNLLKFFGIVFLIFIAWTWFTMPNKKKEESQEKKTTLTEKELEIELKEDFVKVKKILETKFANLHNAFNLLKQDLANDFPQELMEEKLLINSYFRSQRGQRATLREDVDLVHDAKELLNKIKALRSKITKASEKIL